MGEKAETQLLPAGKFFNRATYRASKLDPVEIEMTTATKGTTAWKRDEGAEVPKEYVFIDGTIILASTYRQTLKDRKAQNKITYAKCTHGWREHVWPRIKMRRLLRIASRHTCGGIVPA